MIFILARAVTYSTCFIALFLVFLPTRVLTSFGVVRPAVIGGVEIAGIVIGLAGAILALWCILAFVVLGKGTPAPFDPPRRLVVRGPYRLVRNPMYIGAGLALGGAAILYRSPAVAGYLIAFIAATNAFVLLYEEPTLTRLYGAQYAAYRAAVRRWLPRVPKSTRTPG